MAVLGAATLLFLTLMACVAGGLAEDCSFATLFRHLNLTTDSDWRPHLRPTRHWERLTTVWVTMVVFGITEVNEKAQTITCQTFRTLLWKDEFLHWLPSEFCGINQLEVPRELVWSPDILILEDVSSSGSTTRARSVVLSSNGRVLTHELHQVKTVCQMNLYLFPMDEQHCNLTFGSFSDIGHAILPLIDDMELTSLSEHYMATNGEWELTGITVKPVFEQNFNVSHLIYRISIKRRPMLYIMNCLLPLFCFLVLDVGTFFINWAQGEKLSLKVTLLLSISVLLLMLQDMLPSTSHRMPLIAVYTIVIFCLMAVSLLEAMLVTYLMNMDSLHAKPDPAPSHVVMETKTEAHLTGRAPSEGSEEKEEGPPDHFLLKHILQEVKSVRQEATSAVCSGYRKLGSYGRLALKIDRCFLAVYLVCNVAFLTYIFYMWMLS